MELGFDNMQGLSIVQSMQEFDVTPITFVKLTFTGG